MSRTTTSLGAALAALTLSGCIQAVGPTDMPLREATRLCQEQNSYYDRSEAPRRVHVAQGAAGGAIIGAIIGLQVGSHPRLNTEGYRACLLSHGWALP